MWPELFLSLVPAPTWETTQTLAAPDHHLPAPQNVYKGLQWSTKSTQSLHNDLVLTMSTPSVLVTPAPNWGNRPLFREVTLPRAIILRRTDYISTRPSIMTMPTKVILASSTSAPPPIPADNPWSRLLIMALSITLSVPWILQKKENRN